MVGGASGTPLGGGTRPNAATQAASQAAARAAAAYAARQRMSQAQQVASQQAAQRAASEAARDRMSINSAQGNTLTQSADMRQGLSDAQAQFGVPQSDWSGVDAARSAQGMPTANYQPPAYTPPSYSSPSASNYGGNANARSSGVAMAPTQGEAVLPTPPPPPAPEPVMAPPAPPPPPVSVIGGEQNVEGQSFTTAGNGGTYGGFLRERQARGPKTGTSITPEMLMRIARQRFSNQR